MLVRVITAYYSVCTSQYHQDWRVTEQNIIGVFTDEKAFDNAWAKRPKSWRELEREKFPNHIHLYANEGEENHQWDYEEFELNTILV